MINRLKISRSSQLKALFTLPHGSFSLLGELNFNRGAVAEQVRCTLPQKTTSVTVSQSKKIITAVDEKQWQQNTSESNRTIGWRLLSIIACAVMMQHQSIATADTSAAANTSVSAEVAAQNRLQYVKQQLLQSGALTVEQMEDDVEELKARGKPWSSYHKVPTYPGLIVYPESTAQVSAILKLCHEQQVSVVPFGGGTSVEGQTLSIGFQRASLSLDMCRMNRILALHKEDLDVTVEAGLGYLELNEFLKQHGLWFPLDPGPGAFVGGMCACRCSGSTAVRYGSMRENVLRLTAVLADGTVMNTGSRARKSSAGYDITRLLIGSEGTLAVITEATLKVHRIPQHAVALRISYPAGAVGLHGASLTAKDTLNCGVTIGRCELLDDEMVKILNLANVTANASSSAIAVAVNSNSASNSNGSNISSDSNSDIQQQQKGMAAWPESTTLLYEITGISAAAVQEQVEVVKAIASKHGGHSMYLAADEEERQRIWRQRKECLWSAMSQYPDREPMITDVCVPLTQLAALIAQTKRDINSLSTQLPCPIIAHAGDGNFHVLIFFDPSDATEVQQAKQLATDMAQRAIALGGTCTGEHGVGTGKKLLLQQEMGPAAIKTMQAIKATMDPKLILNPGKVIDMPNTCVDIPVQQGNKSD